MAEYYRELIALRRSNAFFTQADPAAEEIEGSAIRVCWTQGGKPVACAIINPNAAPLDTTLPDGNWELLFGSAEGGVRVPARSVAIFRQK